MEETLKISFTPEKGDYVRASRVLSRQSKLFRIVAALVLVELGVSGLMLISPVARVPGYRSTAQIFFVLGLVFLLYYFLMIPLQLGETFRKTEHMRAERILTFYGTHLNMRIGTGSVDLPWDRFERLITDKGFYILTFTGDDLVYPFIPERAFGDEAAKQKFEQILQGK